MNGEARQADPSGHFVAVGLGQQQVAAFRQLSPEVRQRHRRMEDADPAPRTHQLVHADRRERDQPLEHRMLVLDQGRVGRREVHRPLQVAHLEIRLGLEGRPDQPLGEQG